MQLAKTDFCQSLFTFIGVCKPVMKLMHIVPIKQEPVFFADGANMSPVHLFPPPLLALTGNLF